MDVRGMRKWGLCLVGLMGELLIYQRNIKKQQHTNKMTTALAFTLLSSSFTKHVQSWPEPRPWLHPSL
jgi:hypothetical protein